MVHRIARTIMGIVNRISDVALHISGVMIVIMVFTATYGVVRRYVFSSPEPYSYEISMMFLLFSFVLAISSVERLNQQLRVDIVTNRLPEIAQHFILSIATPVLGIVFVSILTYKGIEGAAYSLQIGEHSASAWKEPMGPIKLMVPVGYAILLLILVVKLVAGVAGLWGMLRGKGRSSGVCAADDEQAAE